MEERAETWQRRTKARYSNNQGIVERWIVVKCHRRVTLLLFLIIVF
jgi:hypothetical protein